MNIAAGGPGNLAPGAPTSAEDAERLWRAPDILALGVKADELRRQRHGDRVTFVRVATVALDAAVDAQWPAAAREVRIVGRPRDIAQAERAVTAVVRRAGGIPVTAFSPADLRTIAPGRAGASEVLARLVGSGLTALAGADVDGDDDLREWVEAALAAGGSVARFGVANACDGSPVRIITAVRALQRATGAVHAFAPLPRNVALAAPTTGYDDVKVVALARLLLDNVTSIQVDWALHGPKLAQVSLLFGADDLDNVSADETSPEGRRRAPLEEVRRNIRAASLTPVERDGRFRVMEP